MVNAASTGPASGTAGRRQVTVKRVAATACLVVAAAVAWASQNGGGAGPGGPPSAKLKLLSFVPGELDLTEAHVPQTVPEYDLPANRLIFRQKDVRLVVQLGTDDTDRIVRINGLLNPDIQVVKGATINMTVVNLSYFLAAALPVGSSPPPYSPPHAIRPAQDVLTPQWGQSRMFGRIRTPILPERGAPHHDPPSKAYDVVIEYRAESSGVAYYREFGVAAYEGAWGRILVVP